MTQTHIAAHTALAGFARPPLLLCALAALIAADCVLTAIAVGGMGATELNPLCTLCGGLPAFLAVKVAVSAAGVGWLWWRGRETPLADRVTGLLCGLYGCVVLWNAASLLQEVIG